MKRLLKIFAFLGGLGAIGWLVKNRFVAVTMNREPETPKLVPEPTTDLPTQGDLTRIEGVAPADADRLHAAGIVTAADLVEADAQGLAARTGLDEAQLATWIEQATALV